MNDGGNSLYLLQSIGSDSDTSLTKYIQPKAKKEKPWWQSSVDTSEEFDTQKDIGKLRRNAMHLFIRMLAMKTTHLS